jgi:peroxiredoxin
MKSISLITAGLTVILLVACGPREVDLVGEWEAAQGNQAVTLVFDPDSTFTMDMGQFVGEGTFTVDAERHLVLRPDGTLASVMPGGFTGRLEGEILYLCSPSGLCTDFDKVR